MKRILLLLLIGIGTLWGEIVVGAERSSEYLPLLQGKKVALVVNHSSLIGGEHLVDYLLRQQIQITKIFAPEHGFRGDADAGEHVQSGRDRATGLPIVSLYGSHKKPTAQDLNDVDVLLFDIQDVGVRFYTYLSTLHYILESGAEQHRPVILLDRPNPNGSRIDGEILNLSYQSFVGLHPVPILYGMTIGEYGRMINGEGWLRGAQKADLTVIPLQNYTHTTPYDLPVKPSPNLPNALSVYLYPSLALFEGTTFSAGRGTDKQFQIYGDPKYTQKAFSFIPVSSEGAKYPKHQNQRCYGVDLRSTVIDPHASLNLNYLIDAYQHYPDKKNFFLKTGFFNQLAGSDRLRQQIEAGLSETEIKASWKQELDAFKTIRQRYLLYP
ncbi:MAG: DUF1343 domain-containing protein [Campylobacterales bacterium]|nr:DUF1343 domain-containing protein [Campylobacterales bacterium]